MRTCEAGACTKPAVYRGPRDSMGAAAWCEEHVPTLKHVSEFLRLEPPLLEPGIELIPGAFQSVPSSTPPST